MYFKIYLILRNTVKQLSHKAIKGFPAIGKLLFSVKLSQRIKTVKKYLKESDFAFLFFTDSHWGANEKKSPKIIKKITKRTGIENVFFGGDIVTHSDVSKDKMVELYNDFIDRFKSSQYSFFPIIGNHDLNSFDQSNENAVFSINEIEHLYEEFFRKISKRSENFNYYVDDEVNQIRFLCLNTIGKKYIDENQKRFIVQALYSTKKNYNIIVISHIWVEWSIENNCYYSNEKINELLEIFDSFNLRKKHPLYDFSDCSSKIILLLGGHIHNNYYTETNAGIPVVLCDCDSINKTYSEPRIISNLPNDQSVHAIIISLQNRKIHVVNIGRGKERHLYIED